MLTPSQIENATQDIAEIYEQLHTEMLSKIAKSMKKNLSRESIEWQVNRAQEVGLLKADIIKMLDKSGQVAREEAVRIMEEAGIRGVAYDNEVYERAGLMDVAPKDYFMSPAMAQILATNLKRNADRLRNITQSTVQGSAEAFQQAMDLAYMQVASGAFTSQEAINNAVSKLADEGITVAQYASGRVIQMDSAVRMAVRTGINQTASTLQLERARELGSDLVEVTAHHGARPDHAVWQGKVYSLSGNHWRFPEFYSTTGYGTPSGLCGVNCRHNFSPYFEGLSEMAYSPNERAELRNETVTFTDATGNPRTVSRYEGEQRLRLIERNIRKYKRKSIVLESAGVDASFEKSKVREWQHKAKKFTDETGIKRKYFREKVDYKKKASTPPIPKVPKKPPTPKKMFEFETPDQFLKKKDPAHLQQFLSRTKSSDSYRIKALTDDASAEAFFNRNAGYQEASMLVAKVKAKTGFINESAPEFLTALREAKIKESRRKVMADMKTADRLEFIAPKDDTVRSYNRRVPSPTPEFIDKIETEIYQPLASSFNGKRDFMNAIRESMPAGGGGVGEDSIMQFMVEKVYKDKKLDALPVKVPRKVFDELRDAGEISIYRGFGSKIERQIEFKESKWYYGKGIYGNGTYTAVELDTAIDYARGDYANVQEFILHPKAKIIDYDDLHEFTRSTTGELYGRNPDGLGIVHDALGEDGRLAIAMGYDAIYVADSDYFVVLNRGKLIYSEKDAVEQVFGR